MDYLVFKEKSLENLEIAEISYEKSKYNVCVKCAYYSMFQIAVALLIKDGKQFGDKIKHDNIISSGIMY